MKEANGLNVFGVIREIWRQKVLFFITLLLISLAVFLSLFLFNRSTKSANVTFDLSFVGIADFKYPNRSDYYYDNIISLERLSKVKESDGKYSKIDILNMLNKNSITISKNLPLEELNTTVYGSLYKINVSMSYFDNDADLLNSFFNDLLNLELDNITLNQASNLTYLLESDYLLNLDYLDVLRALESQYYEILYRYQLLIEENGDNFSIHNEQETVINKMNRIKNQFNQGSLFRFLENEIIENKYSKIDSSYKGKLLSQIQELERDKVRIERNISDLKAASLELPYGSNDISGYLASEIIALNEVLEQLDLLRLFYNNGVNPNTSFIERMESVLNELNTLVEQYNNDYNYYLSSKTTLRYIINEKSIGIITIEEKLGTMLILLLSVFIGIVISLATVYIKYQYNIEKKIVREQASE